MYAVIMQSNSTESGIRQTAIIPNPYDLTEPKIYTRSLGNNLSARGIAGAWLPVSRIGRGDLWVTAETETVLGKPVAVGMTVNDERDLIHGKPTVLLQKLARTVQSNLTPSTSTFDEVFTKLCHTADHTPEHLSQYAKSNTFSVVSAPAVDVVREVEPVAVPVADVAEPSQNAERVWANLVVPPKPTYYTRTIDGLDEVDVYTRGIANGDAFLLTGEAGVGKTESVTHLASYLNRPMVRIEMHQSLSLADTEGRLLPTLDGGWRWHYSRLATAIRQPSVILLNELSRSLPSNATLFLGLLNERQLQIEQLNEVIEVHPECVFIADQNIGNGYAVREQDKALLDRFNVKLEFGDDPVIEGKLIPSPSLLELANSLRFLHKQEPAKHRTRVGLRMLLNFVKQTKTYNFTFAVNRFLANFPEAEREAVSMQIDSRHINIAQELGVSPEDVAQYVGGN
jgi:nitric oxide reductase NorQ protein